ncbi:hypothetical protein EDD17DRAFT_1649554 [Pisolithus thermaeus]|nr:hypothetical protein EDD17DRAFT_1649554 [Pisolithus thermaeus]
MLSTRLPRCWQALSILVPPVSYFLISLAPTEQVYDIFFPLRLDTRRRHCQWNLCGIGSKGHTIPCQRRQDIRHFILTFIPPRLEGRCPVVGDAVRVCRCSMKLRAVLRGFRTQYHLANRGPWCNFLTLKCSRYDAKTGGSNTVRIARH